MFIQVIRGRTRDARGVRRQLDSWLRDLAPVAAGWLGSTAGITDEGTFIASARFDSEAAARRNSERAEQGRWWEETSRLLEDPRFRDCTEVDEYKASASDDAGFVQVIQGRVADVAGYREASKRLERETVHPRDDVIGGIVAWEGSHFTELVYFTSEEEARRGERRPEIDVALEKRWSLTQDLEYFDLRDPWLASP
jgi:hypothetical protein